jgi:hypothetical protein
LVSVSVSEVINESGIGQGLSIRNGLYGNVDLVEPGRLSWFALTVPAAVSRAATKLGSRLLSR